MVKRGTRRRFLRSGAAAGILTLAGCGSTNDGDSTPTGASATGEPAGNDGAESATESMTEPSQASGPRPTLPAEYVVWKGEDEVVAMDGRSLERVRAGAAGAEDGAVLQHALAAMRGGGRLFVKNATYTVDRQLNVLHPHTEIVSDSARLRFGDHELYGDPNVEEQVDLNLRADFARLSGLVVDGNKAERSTATRTVNVSSAANVTIQDCVIRGGRSENGNRGYGIGPYHTNHLVVENCLIADNDRHGIHPGSSEGPFADVRISNCTFLRNASDPSGAAVDIRDHTRSALVVGNYFEGNGNGVRVKGENVGTLRVADNVLVGNRTGTDSSGQVQVWVDDAEEVAITDNTFVLEEGGEGVTHVELTPAGPVGTATVTGNRFAGGGGAVFASGDIRWLVVEDNGFAGATAECFAADEATYALVTGNRFDQADADGDTAVLLERIDHGLVTDNVVVDAGIETDDTVERARNRRW